MAETIATYSVPAHHVALYTANVQAALQKKGGLIMPLVSQGSYQGEKIQVVQFIGPIEFVERNNPYADTKLSELEHTSRWISGREYDAAVLVDRLDLLKMIYDPTSPYVERMREAAARRMDGIIMQKFFAAAVAGKSGELTVTFPTRDVIPHGGAKVTVAKLRSLRKLIKKRHVDLRSVRPTVLVTADDADSLLGETVVQSADYNAVKPLVDGEVSNFMGFTFVPYEDSGDTNIDIPTANDGVAYRRLPVFLSDGMHYGSWAGLEITVSNRADKNNIKQLHATFTGGATRIEEGKVFELQVTTA